MKLAEGIRTIKSSQTRMGYVLRDFYDLAQSPPTEENEQRLKDLLREINGMVVTRAALRTRIARALKDHPEMVEALAERSVARWYQNSLNQVQHSSRLADFQEEEVVWEVSPAQTAFDALFVNLPTKPTPKHTSGVKLVHPEGYYELISLRKEQAVRRLFEANLSVERLSAGLELPSRRDFQKPVKQS